ncbi:MAG: replication factor C small subunit [Candidatus Nanohaloarchaeota archaeon]|nr:replication factor C small subunit [Candidatus Nanohaloarchaeota archaeon]
MVNVNEIWTEKYRPKSLDEVVDQEHVVERLKAFVKQKNIPNLLFAGPAGTGKTTCALALARDLYGENWKHNFLELNASDERGIDVVRGKIKDFARTKPIDADFKIIFLDEADALTQEAQQALRRTMEKYASVTRFILSCNYSSKIIPPIQSRCAVFRFKPLPDEAIKSLLKKIAEKENISITEEALNALIVLSEGDLRKAINILQSTAILYKEIDETKIYEMAASLKPKEVEEIVRLALKGEFRKAREQLLKLIALRGLSGQDVVKSFYRAISDLDVDDKLKVQLIDKLGEYEFRIAEGASEDVQIEAMLAQFVLIGKTHF